MRLTLLLMPLLLMLAVPGCSAISVLDEASQPLEVYELRTPEIPQVAARQRDIEVVVEEPVASGALATERIVIRPSPLQTQYLPGVRWADPAPAMLQTLIVRSLTETEALGSVGRRPIGSRSHFAVLSELTDFQAAAKDGQTGATISIRLMARLVNEREARVVALRTFSVAEESATTDVDEVVAAFDRAAKRLLLDIVPWLVASTAPSS